MGRRETTAVAAVLLAVLSLAGLASRRAFSLVVPTQGTVAPRPEPGFTRSIRTQMASQSQPPGQNLSALIPDWLAPVLAAILALAVIGLVALVVYRLSRLRLAPRARRAEPATGSEVVELSDEDRDELGASFAGTLASLRLGGDVDEAVVACWRGVEQIAARQGVERLPTQTAQEFVLDVLTGTTASRDELTTLADLYRSALFSGRALTEADRARAIACLELLTAQMSPVEPVAGLAPPEDGAVDA